MKKSNPLGKGKKSASAKKSEDDILGCMDLLKTEKAGYIEAEGLERTFHLQQDELVKHVSLQAAKKRFDLKLDGGSLGYSIDYTANGRYLLMGGSSGHLAAFDWIGGRLKTELNVEEPVADVAWLQDENLFAAAQKEHVFIYDHSGTELHCLRKHTKPTHLEYLRHHFLLFSACGDNHVRYQDVSTGQLIAEWNTKAGLATAMTQNTSNAVTFTGHSGGVVSLWSPTISSPLVKMFVHKGPVSAISVDSSGNYMATAGLDGRLKTWDLRTFKNLDMYQMPGKHIINLSISQTGLLAAASGPWTTIWKDVFRSHQKTPYMRHLVEGQSIRNLSFCPYEDVLGIGHTGGFSSILCPGSGEANYDAYVANPFATKRQKQESQVKQLLDKLQPETIMLDPSIIGSVRRSAPEAVFDLQVTAADANGKPLPQKEKKKARGKSSAQRRLLRRRANIIDEAKMQAAEEARRTQIIRSSTVDDQKDKPMSALDRFVTKAL